MVWMTLVLELQAAWAVNAACAPDWTPENPARGQCALSTLVVWNLLGGVVMRGVTNRGTVHYWNELPGGVWLDVTRSQFSDDEVVVEVQRNPPDELWRFEDTVARATTITGRVLAQVRAMA